MARFCPGSSSVPPGRGDALLAGGCPALYDRALLPRHWCPAYVTADVARDVRQPAQVRALDALQRFMGRCAGRQRADPDFVAERVKTLFSPGERRARHSWRDSNGNEVDVIAAVGSRLLPVEIRSAQALDREFVGALARWHARAGARAVPPVLVYGGAGSLERQGVRLLGWNAVANVSTE